MLSFALLYYPYTVNVGPTGAIVKIIKILKPSITLSRNSTWFSPFYYSVVTFTTLGYGYSSGEPLYVMK
jgi:hypothetical protein